MWQARPKGGRVATGQRVSQLADQFGSFPQEGFDDRGQRAAIAVDGIKRILPIDHAVQRSRSADAGGLAAGAASVTAAIPSADAIGIHQLVDAQRFRDILVHSRGQAPFSVALHRVCGHRDDGCVTPGFAFEIANLFRGGQAVHAGHLYVHQNDVRRSRLPGDDRIGTARHDGDAMTLFMEQFTHQFLIHQSILGHQHVERRQLPNRRQRDGGFRLFQGPPNAASRHWSR